MSSRNTPFVFVCFLAFIGFLSPGSAQAQLSSQEITKALNAAAEKTSQDLQANIDRIKAAIETSTAEQKDTMISQEKERVRLANTPSIDYNILFSLIGVPSATAGTSMLTTSAMDGRYRELQLIPQNAKNTALYPGGVDSTTGSLANDPANVKVYMNYFCDPLAQDGKMKDVTIEGVKCGAGRFAALGDPGANPYTANTETARQNLQIMGLPLKPQLLLFEPSTFPVEPDQSAASGSQSNTNKLSGLIYAGYRYFERLVLGKPPGKALAYDITTASGQEAFLTNQGVIANKMLASYPFALLFAERIGTMVNKKAVSGTVADMLPSPPQAAANVLRTSYAGTTADPQILAIVKQLETQPSMSMAQYLDILAYKLPMSPGYITRINGLTPDQLRREKVFLMGIQTVLKYNINRWMEISTAIEAASKP